MRVTLPAAVAECAHGGWVEIHILVEETLGFKPERFRESCFVMKDSMNVGYKGGT